MATLGHSEALYEKKGFAHCVEEGGFTDEYRMYNGERTRPLFVWNVDNGAKGQFCLLQENRMGMGTSLAFICLGQAWKFGQLPFLSFS